MFDCVFDSFIDTLKLLPYLFVTFLLLEVLEHKLNRKNEKILRENQKYGPLLGGVLGALPQCGFSAMASHLFSSKIITMGTLIAVFLSTSDEMLPIMISEKVALIEILKIIGSKILIGILVGFLVDLIYRPKREKNHIHELCEKEHCDCEEDGIFLSSIKHALKISLFIFLANTLLNCIIYKIGVDTLKELLQNNSILHYFLAGFVGLIPNCASSVVLTEVYLSDLISFGTLMSGLLTGTGIGILLLFKTNHSMKENFIILSIIYCVGVSIGFLIDLF